ncbi:phosphotransferase [Actinoplanes sp. NPDC051470]|uniref:phosphotransferase n=1 Tax=Actinoplanes sp. NPDC051470 TaxID=3157224 RepID=UPI00341850A0
MAVTRRRAGVRNRVSPSLDEGYNHGMTEEALAGGNTVGAARIGDVVHKQTFPWTPTVHALLRHLEDAGFDGAPRVLGFDDQGREMLTFLPGETAAGQVPWPVWSFTDVLLTQVGRWMRRLHDVTAGFVPPADAQWFTGRTMEPGLVIGHQDVAPYNAAVLDGDRLVGFFDWDSAFPSTREFDLALAALWWVPLCPPEIAEGIGFHHSADRSRRLHLLLDAYGYDGDRHAFGATVVGRARRQAATMREMAEAGDPAATALASVAGYMEQSADHIEALPTDFWVR